MPQAPSSSALPDDAKAAAGVINRTQTLQHWQHRMTVLQKLHSRQPHLIMVWGLSHSLQASDKVCFAGPGAARGDAAQSKQQRSGQGAGSDGGALAICLHFRVVSNPFVVAAWSNPT